MRKVTDSKDDKNWETEFYQINYYSFEQSFKDEPLKEYINIEKETDKGDIFRSSEKEPESLTMFINSMLISMKEMTVPAVVNIKKSKRKDSNRCNLNESVLTDITRYYKSEEVKNENEFVEKINIIKGHFQAPDHPLSEFLSIFSQEF